jgi:SulP family sulfate permease
MDSSPGAPTPAAEATPRQPIRPFVPALLLALHNYGPRSFLADLLAGVTVGLVALPLAMAFAISSGLAPESGLYCAVIAGFVASALGGSRLQVSGPTGAFVVVVAGVVAHYGIQGLFMCTLMAGVVLVALGLSGLGTAVKYIPRSVVVGFTNGIAVLIASTQLKDFFGLSIEHVPGDFLERMRAILAAWPTLSAPTTVLGSACLVALLLMARVLPRVPGAILVLVGGTLAAVGLGLPVESIGSRFGGIPAGFPAPHIPPFKLELMLTLLSPAMTIALLGAIESLMSAVVADRMTGDRHNPNVELVAQGAANVISPLFGGLPVTGAIARTATNVRAGARTPLSGIIHALTLLAVLLFASSLARPIPLSVLSAILFVVAWNMGEWREIPEILRLSRADKAVWAITFFLTVFADLTAAVEVGMILAALLYIMKVTSTTSVRRITPDYIVRGQAHVLQGKDIPADVAIFAIHGPFLFGSADKLGAIDEELPGLPPVVVLRLRNMPAIDGTGLGALEDLADRLHESGRSLVMCDMREQPTLLMHMAEFERHVGPENICPTFDDALRRSRELLAVRDPGSATRT